MRLSLTVEMSPQSKERPRFTVRHTYTPANTAAAEDVIRTAWMAAHGNLRWVDDQPLLMAFTAVVHRPKRPTFPYPVRGDVDNLFKLAADALNGTAYRDDCQIVKAVCEKRYCLPNEKPHVEITLEDYPGLLPGERVVPVRSSRPRKEAQP